MYIQIGRLELFLSKNFYIEHIYGHCGCHIFHITWFGFTWLSNECKKRLE